MEGPTEPACIFFGVKIPAGQQVVIEPTLDEETFEVVHLTQVALGASPSKGSHVVFLKGSEDDDEDVAIGTLDRERCSQFSVDFSLGTSGVALSHSGASDVYVSGYRVVSLQPDQDGLDFTSDESESESESGEEEEDSDEEDEAPDGIPLAERQRRINGFLQGLAKKGGNGKDDDEDDSDDSDDSDDDDEAGEDAAIAGEEDDEQSDSSDDDDDDEEGGDSSDDDDDDDEDGESDDDEEGGDSSDDDDEEGDSDDDSDSDSSDAEASAAAAAAAFGGKRPGSSKSSTPAGKRRKLDPYAAAVAEVLAERGPQPLSTLGSVIKRPAGAPKLKAVIAAHPGIFKVDGAGNVKLH